MWSASQSGSGLNLGSAQFPVKVDDQLLDMAGNFFGILSPVSVSVSCSGCCGDAHSCAGRQTSNQVQSSPLCTFDRTHLRATPEHPGTRRSGQSTGPEMTTPQTTKFTVTRQSSFQADSHPSIPRKPLGFSCAHSRPGPRDLKLGHDVRLVLPICPESGTDPFQFLPSRTSGRTADLRDTCPNAVDCTDFCENRLVIP